ncbi:tripartite tricarboxylate transporter TctB family protein [Shumkonia mesophila]|uniref:tripartite tricarboxylate transporter TctB family protein n=1 Tax=Shumkonia mesophila TaxID=2838854 RepID=UPI002934499D|nr:tripartite tricarboxylate transporter TctB family protein [Shumkonia mesophila]
MKPDTLTKADLITGLVLIVFSLTLIEESWRMPRLEQLGVHPSSVPGLVPGLLGVILLILGAVLTVRSVRRGGHHLGITRENTGQTIRQPGNLRLLITLVLCVVYAAFMIGNMPYWLATGIFTFLFIALFEWRPEAERRARVRGLAFAAVIAAVVAGAVTWVFANLFLVTLP